MAVPYTFGSATTSIPLSQLDSNFATTITLGNTAVQLGNTITTLTGVTNVASGGALTLGSNGNTTAVYVDTSQNVGIGTASPSDKLEISRVSSSNSTGGLSLTNSDASGYGSAVTWRLKLDAVNVVNAGRIYVEAGSATATFMPFQTAISSTVAERMRIDSSGNLLVGATTPYSGTASNFTATTGVDIGSSSTATSKQLQFIRNGTTGTAGSIYATAGSFSNYCGMDFVIDNVGGGSQAGSIKINTTSNATSATRMLIDSSGNTYFQYGGATNTGAPSGVSLTGPANTLLQIYLLKNTQVEAHIGFKSSSDTNFYVGTSGGLTGVGSYGLYQQNVTNSWTSVSDERVKTELQPIENALEKVANVRTVTGRFTYDEENGVTRRLPFLIAQDFLTALPEAVDRQDPDKLGLSYSDTVVLAFAAIKELKAVVDAQAETINALTARIVALEAK
jgi:hypothetical protein